MRTRIYIDGYNFYFGCLKGTPYKWLDFLTLFEEKILPSSASVNGKALPSQLDPLAIKFFTALVLEKVAKNGDSIKNQERYLSKASIPVHRSQQNW
jgi:6-hydroxy-3-succinoylpyridine 3-monooxygenase